jgi:hypothetical protein
MHLIHGTYASIADFYKILKDGWLKPEQNPQLHGKERSKYIYLMVESKKNNFMMTKIGNIRLELSAKLLLENRFYLHKGWHGAPITKIQKKEYKNIYEISGKQKISKFYDGRELTSKELAKDLGNMMKELNMIFDNTHDKEYPLSMIKLHSHEILVLERISLKKYLKKVEICYVNNESIKGKVIKYLEENYPKVKVVKCKKR